MSDSVHFLGTSDGLPSPDRHHASLLVKLGKQTLLLDCGEPCSDTLKRRGIDFDSIDAIFVSHTHSDHVGGLPMLIQSLWLEQRARPLPVWMPRRTIAPFRQWLHTCFLYEPLLGFPLQWKPLSPRTTARCGNVRLRAYRTSHLDSARAQFARKFPKIGFDAFSFLIEGNGKRIAYSGDIGHPQDLEPLLRKPLDLLVVELAHCSPAVLLEFLRSHPVKHVAFTHLNRTARSRSMALRRLAARILRPASVTFPADGDTVRF
jgi:ribonuclease BN (tRNA processing enzyme)